MGHHGADLRRFQVEERTAEGCNDARQTWGDLGGQEYTAREEAVKQ